MESRKNNKLQPNSKHRLNTEETLKKILKNQEKLIQENRNFRRQIQLQNAEILNLKESLICLIQATADSHRDYYIKKLQIKQSHQSSQIFKLKEEDTSSSAAVAHTQADSLQNNRQAEHSGDDTLTLEASDDEFEFMSNQ